MWEEGIRVCKASSIGNLGARAFCNLVRKLGRICVRGLWGKQVPGVDGKRINGAEKRWWWWRWEITKQRSEKFWDFEIGSGLASEDAESTFFNDGYRNSSPTWALITLEMKFLWLSWEKWICEVMCCMSAHPHRKTVLWCVMWRIWEFRGSHPGTAFSIARGLFCIFCYVSLLLCLALWVILTPRWNSDFSAPYFVLAIEVDNCWFRNWWAPDF